MHGTLVAQGRRDIKNKIKVFKGDRVEGHDGDTGRGRGESRALRTGMSSTDGWKTQGKNQP